MSREAHVRFWERAGVRFPRATRLPLYRQSQIFARQGIALDRSTLCDWVGRACWWLEPLWRLLRRHVLGSTRIFAEDRKGEHPAAHLAGFQGILQVDGYSGFKSLLENRPPGAIRLAFC